MSTKAIRRLLEKYKAACEADPHGMSAVEAIAHSEATAEVEAIEKAACVLVRCDIAGPPDMSVEEYTPASVTISHIAKESQG